MIHFQYLIRKVQKLPPIQLRLIPLQIESKVYNIKNMMKRSNKRFNNNWEFERALLQALGN